MPPDPRDEWVGPLPTDPLELALEYKLGFDDVSDLQDQKCFLAWREDRIVNTADIKVIFEAMIEALDDDEKGPCQVEYLFFARQQIDDAGMEYIAKAMEAGAMPKLLTVDFSSNKLTDTGFTTLVNAVKHCKQFRDIKFKNNSLTDVGFAALHEMLKRGECPGLERLDLAGDMFIRHNISDASFVPFATDLADGVFKTIRPEEFEMSDTEIGDAGFAAFSVSIKRGNLRKLKSLYLQGCRITDEGANALAEAIGNNKRTKLFDIRLGFQNMDNPEGARVTKDGGKAAIESAGERMGRKVFVVLHPLNM